MLFRCTPEAKYALIVGLKQLKIPVAVVGSGTNDVPALNAADVGISLAMSSTDMCRNASGIILLDDSLRSVLTCCMWGRNTH